MRRLLSLLLILPLLLAAKPEPSATLTLVSLSPVTLTAEFNHIPRPNETPTWVGLGCVNDANETTYWAEENVDADGFYIFDENVWVLWTGTLPKGTCRAFAMTRLPRSTGDTILDTTDWFQVP